MTLVVPSSEIEIVEKIRVYDSGDFLADIGGYSGLFLGLSFIGLIDYLVGIAGKYMN